VFKVEERSEGGWPFWLFTTKRAKRKILKGGFHNIIFQLWN